MRRFAQMIRFLTVIKVGRDEGFDPDFHKGIMYFPLVGFIIGIIAYLAFLILNIFTFNLSQVIVFLGQGQDVITYRGASRLLFDLFLAALVVIMNVYLSGGLHLDGFSDTSDAFYSYRTREKMLDIMKDSRVGNQALINTICLILWKVVVYSLLIYSKMSILIVIIPMISRLTATDLTFRSKTPRSEGMGNAFIGKARFIDVLTPHVYIILLSVIMFYICRKLEPITGIFGVEILVSMSLGRFVILLILNLLAVFVTSVFVRRTSYKKIGGITGDVLGFGIEFSEAIILLVSFIALGYLIS